MAQVPADFADWLDYLAVAALLAFSWNEGPIVLAWLAVALGAPYVFVGPFAGALVDRMPILRVLIASNLGRAVMTASLALAPGWQTLLVLVFLRNSVDAFFTPAKQAAIQATTGPQDRLAANGLSHGINQASKIVAPALGAGLLVVFEPSQIFIVNAFVSLAAAVLLVGSKPIERRGPDDEEPSRSVLAGALQGWRTVRRSLRLRAAVALMAGGFFALFLYDTQIALLMRAFGFAQSQLGLAMAAVGLGGVAGSLSFGLTEGRSRSFHLIAVGALASAIAAVGLGLAETYEAAVPFAVLIGIFVVLGFAFAMMVVPTRTVLQLETPPSQMARVVALSEACNTVSLLTAPFVGAAIAAVSSVGMAFIAGGVLLVCLAISSFLIESRPASSAVDDRGPDHSG